MSIETYFIVTVDKYILLGENAMSKHRIYTMNLPVYIHSLFQRRRKKGVLNQKLMKSFGG